jgi:hypothetical protein
MIALITSLLIFTYLAVVGMATTEAVRFRCGLIRGWLIAPAVGLAVLTLSVMLLSQAGIPVQNFALSLTACLLVASTGVLWWRRPILPWRHVGPFWAVLLFALIYIGWQCFQYGFNWVGYGNGDALAYSQSASRLVDHGFFDTPKLGELLGRDYTQAAWFQFGPGMYRCGFDVILAWAAALTWMNPLAIYMPLMLCLAIVQVSALAALVMAASCLRRRALLASILLAMSPLFGFSTIAQLGPQMGGFALFLGLCSLTLRSGPVVDPGWRCAIKHAFVIAVLGVSLAIFYPEALPFWGLSYLAFHIVVKATGHSNLHFTARVAALAAACAVVLGRYNLLRGYFSAIWAISSSKKPISGQAVYTGFEVFKLPHGAAALFGLSHNQTLAPTPWLTIQIVLGFLLFYLCVRGSLTDVTRRRPYAFILLTVLLAGIALFSAPNAFGLFKVGLYIQPVLMAALAHVAGKLRQKRTVIFLAAYFLISFSPHVRLVTGSTGALTGLSATGVNLPGISGKLLLQTDTPSSVPAQALSLYLKGVRLEMVNGRDPLGQKDWVGLETKPLLGSLNPYPVQVAESENLTAGILKTYQRESCLGFAFLRTDLPHDRNDRVFLATTSPLLSHFNGLQRSHDLIRDFFTYRELEGVKDYLVFINSDKTSDYYSFASEPSFHALEPDPYRSGRSFYGMGRYFLFEVLNPSDKLRVRVSLSQTVLGDGRTRLPEGAVVLGDAVAPVGLIGAGAANIFSEPIHPVLHNGHYYLALDFKTLPISPPNRKVGLMRLFNKEIPVDVRKLIGYGRDISVISEKDYQGLARPRSVTRWPEALFGEPSLEFSGFYEDGWISDRAMMRLGPSRTGEQLVIKGMVPDIGEFARQGNMLQVRIDGTLSTTERLPPGAFEVHVPIRKDLNVTSVNLDFALQESLPKGDDRPVAARIEFLAIR